MRYDVLIKNGHVIDPAAGTDGLASVGIRAGRVAACGTLTDASGALEIDASGWLVLPGLVDFHTHLFHAGSALGAHPELVCLPQGVTTAVEAGSAGLSAFGLLAAAMETSPLRMKACLYVQDDGIGPPTREERLALSSVSQDRLAHGCRRYAHHLVGLKVRLGRRMTHDEAEAEAVLHASLQAAEQAGLPLWVHTTDPALPPAVLVRALRAGDVYAHIHHGTGSPLLNARGHVDEAFWEARERGVVFDAAVGVRNWSVAVARASLAQSFAPQVISSDVSYRSQYQPQVFGLPRVMAAYMALGMTLSEVVACCTATPARLLGLAGETGTLAPGAAGDVALFKLETTAVQWKDSLGEVLEGQHRLTPCMTLREGVVRHACAEAAERMVLC